MILRHDLKLQNSFKEYQLEKSELNNFQRMKQMLRHYSKQFEFKG